MHKHDFCKLLARTTEGDSVDSYYTCVLGCSYVLHVYTYAPGNIRYETAHEGTSWASGYAHGLARGSKVK